MKKICGILIFFVLTALFMFAIVTVNASPSKNFIDLGVIATKSDPTGSNLNPTGIAASENEVFFTDTINNAVYKYSDDAVQLFAGLPTEGRGGYVDAVTQMAKFSAPSGILAIENKVYIADKNNDSIRIITGNTVSTFSGGLKKGWRDGDKRSALYNNPTAICADAEGNMFVADTGNNSIRKISAQNEVTTLAGKSENVGFLDGKAEDALFNAPVDIKEYDGALYVADSENKAIRMIKDGEVSTVLSNKSQNIVSKISVQNFEIGRISSLAINDDGTIYFADVTNNIIYKIEKSRLSVFIDKDSVINTGIYKPETFIKEPSALFIHKENLYIGDTSTGYVVQVKMPTKE